MSYIDRRLTNRILKALTVHPVVFVNGPRQAGKSTLVHALIQKDFPAHYVSMDSITTMALAAKSPEGYLKQYKEPLVIDEVQMVPELFRAIKVVVDTLRLEHGSKLAGRYLLTGSANIMALPKLSDALVGRMGVLTLYPLAAFEIAGGEGQFIEKLFANAFSPAKNHYDLIDMMYRATFPQLSEINEDNRGEWLDSYLTTILQRDMRDLADIDKLTDLPDLLRVLASRAGGLINDADISRDVGLNPTTVRNYKTLLNALFVTLEIAPWFRNIGKRYVKASKGYLIDTQLLCYLLASTPENLEQDRPHVFGHVLENFVATELTKLLSIHGRGMGLYHFRTADHKEVDFVIEKLSGELVGIEVKNSDHVKPVDFKGLKVLQDQVGKDFCSGVVLYRGQQMVPFGENMWALPMHYLWS